MRADPAMLSLFPLYLNFELQHSLLTTTQRILEKSLFEFGLKVVAETVREKGWDCAQCVELNDWVKILRRRPDILPKQRVEGLNKSLQMLLDSIVQIRHTAVHRQRVTANAIESFLADAECFARLLDDHTCTLELANIRQETSSFVQRLANQQKSTQEKLVGIASHNKTQETKLRFTEHLAVKQVLQEAQEHEYMATSTFQHTVSLETTSQDAASVAVCCSDGCTDHSNQLSIRLCSACVDHLRGTKHTELRL